MSRFIFLALPVVLSMMAYPATAFTPPSRSIQSALLMDNTIYVQGGIDPAGNIVSNMYSLDVSQSWPCTNPAWADRTSDAGTFAVPATELKPMWPSADGKSFYIWGGASDNSAKLSQNGFAQYNVVTKSWSLPSSISNMPQQRFDLAVVLASTGVAYFWSGLGSNYTGYTSVPYSQHIFNDMFTFDTTKLAWKVLQITGNTPVLRVAHTATMLSNDQMVIIGGLTSTQTNVTYVNMDLASMNDIPVFDTKTTTWTMYSATGNVPVGRRYHTAVLSTDGISIIICCGGTSKDSVNLNDVAVLNTQTWLWTQPSIDGVAPTARYAPSSAMVNGQMIVFFGTDNEFNCLNDVNVLDTRKTPFQWTSSFTSNTSPNGLTIVGGIGGVIGISIAVLIIIAILIFLVVRKPWRKAKDHPEPNKVPTDQYIYNAEPNRQPLEAHQTQMANLYTPYANSGPPANQYNSYIEARPPAGQYISYADARPSANQYNSYAEARPSPQTHQMPPPMYQKQFNSQHNPFANPDGPPMQIEQRVDSVLPVSEIVYSKPNVLLEIVNTKPDVKD